jgi:hypothetical protein
VCAHADLRERAQHLVEALGVDLEAHAGALHAEIVDAGQLRQSGERAGEVGLDRGPREMAQVRERAALDGAPAPDDAHAVTHRLDLGEDVAGEQHRAPAAALLHDALTKDGLHQRVQARGRLVQDEQLHVGGQRGHERDLLAVALRVGAALLGRIEVEALEQLASASRVQAAAQPAEQVDDLAAGEVGPQRHVAGHVREPAVQRDDVAPRVAVEQADGAAVGAQQAEQDADRRRLARAVGAEEGVHLARGHLEVQAIERPRRAEGLAQIRDRDRGRHVAHHTSAGADAGRRAH